MKRYYHGNRKPGPWFEGWYFKCRTVDEKAIALIPAYHIGPHGQRSASLQVISDAGTWWIEYPKESFTASSVGFSIGVGKNRFSEEGLSVNLTRPEIELFGELKFGPFLRLSSDIMGPFQLVPGMECSHGVISMGHALDGTLTLNGERLDFTGGHGYIETDRGRSFPDTYLWAQASFPGAALMLSIASIPLLFVHFTGCICSVILNGKEYRLATYRGVRVERWTPDEAVIRQGGYRLEIRVEQTDPKPLRAPSEGTMARTIHESLKSVLRCRFWHGETLLFEGIDQAGSFEFSAPDLQKP